MKVLVTGGAGYIGAMLVPWLLQRGHKVTVFDTMWFGDGELRPDQFLKVIKGDIRSADQLKAACKGQQAVIALACVSAEQMCQRSPVVASTVNVGGAANMALCAKQSGVARFIYASSVAAYPQSENGSKEVDRLYPTSIYGHCKTDAEKEVLESFPQAVIVRCASVCGYSPHQRLDLTVNMMVHDAVRRGVITVNGGAQKRSHIHIKDVCDFYALLLDITLERSAGQVFNVVAQNMTVLETAELVAKLTGARIDVRPKSDNRSYTVDGTKARDVLGFWPKRTIEQAVADLKRHFDRGDWADSLTNPLYMNVAHGLA